MAADPMRERHWNGAQDGAGRTPLHPRGHLCPSCRAVSSDGPTNIHSGCAKAQDDHRWFNEDGSVKPYAACPVSA